MELVDLPEELVHKLRNPIVARRAFRPSIGHKQGAVGDCRNRRPLRHKIGIGLARKLRRKIFQKSRREIYAWETILVDRDEMKAVLFLELGERRLRRARDDHYGGQIAA